MNWFLRFFHKHHFNTFTQICKCGLHNPSHPGEHTLYACHNCRPWERIKCVHQNP